MSGIAGCLFFENNYNGSLVGRITAMLIPLASSQNHQIQYYSSSDNCALGICDSNDVNTAKILQDHKSNYVIAFNGCLYNTDDLISLAGITYDSKSSIETEIILRLFEKYGNRLFGFLQGIFAFAIWDKKQKNLTIGSDRHGYEYIYYYRDKHKFLFASEIKSILSILDFKPEANIDSICDIHNFNAIFNTKTPFKDIHLMPHAGICRVNKELYEIKQYWDYPIYVEHFSDTEDKLMTRAKIMIQDAVEKSIRNSKDLGIMLSGGLDSRLLASVLQKKSQKITAFSFQWGEFKSKENILAKQIANKLNISFRYLGKPNVGILDFINKSIMDSDGHWGFCDLLPYILKVREEYPGISLVNGFLMDTLFKSGWAFFPNDNNQLLGIDQVIKRYSVMGEYISDMIFIPDFSELLKKKKRETIDIAIKDFPANKPAEVSLRFYCINRGRRTIMSSFKVLNRYVNIIFPGTSYDLADFAFRLPYQMRSSTDFYRKLIYTWFPDIGAIPWDRTGKPLDRGISQRDKKLEALLFKIKYAFQRATKGQIDLLNSGVSFNRQFRKDKKFRGLIMDILYDKRTLTRGFFDINGVNTLIKRQLSGRDYDKVFKSIISVEMLFRNFIDV